MSILNSAKFSDKLKYIAQVLKEQEKTQTKKLKPIERKIINFLLRCPRDGINEPFERIKPNGRIILAQGAQSYLNGFESSGFGLEHILYRHFGDGAESEISTIDIVKIFNTLEKGTMHTIEDNSKTVFTRNTERYVYTVVVKNDDGFIITYYKNEVVKYGVSDCR